MSESSTSQYLPSWKLHATQTRLDLYLGFSVFLGEKNKCFFLVLSPTHQPHLPSNSLILTYVYLS
jgi:hypothetical protein